MEDYSFDKPGKDATKCTKDLNARALETLKEIEGTEPTSIDLRDAKRGFLRKMDHDVLAPKPHSLLHPIESIRPAHKVYPLKEMEAVFRNEEAIKSGVANPILFHQGELNAIHGLFEVVPGIYQLRGYDLANMSLVRSENGFIVIDTLTTEETSSAAMKLARDELGPFKVTAVIYTHSHGDHFGGVKGVLGNQENVPIYGPPCFSETVINEVALTGNIICRRSSYMYGSLLKPSEDGKKWIGSGIGTTPSIGKASFIPPTIIIGQQKGNQPSLPEALTTIEIDGIFIECVNTPGAEAPSEMMFYFPKYKAICMSEELTHTMHSLCSLRGSRARDPYIWSDYLKDLKTWGRFSEAEVAFSQHHWPKWGKENISQWLDSQRDLYKFIADQTLRLANLGYNMVEIAEMIAVPKSLGHQSFNRSYFGTMNHNVKATYQRYIGWFDGNPATLHTLPRTETALRYVEMMGGAENVLKKAKEYYAKGDYRWVVEVVNHVIYVDPTNSRARELQADALEQLGYQAESGPWRNFYLSAAQALRHPHLAESKFIRHSSLSIFNCMSLCDAFAHIGIRVDPQKMDNKKFEVNMTFTDIKDEKKNKYLFFVENCVTNYYENMHAKDPNGGEIELSTSTWKEMIFGSLTPAVAIHEGKIKFIQHQKVPALDEIFSSLTKFDNWFPLVEPKLKN